MSITFVYVQEYQVNVKRYLIIIYCKQSLILPTPEWRFPTMTTSQGSSFEDSTTIPTRTDIELTNQTTGSSVMTSSTSRGVGFYFQCAVIVIGFLGAASNGLILYAMIVSKQHKKQVLIFNQNLLDFVSCFFLFATQVVKLCNISLSGRRGHLLCVTVLSEAFSLGPFLGSLINLAAITIERYLKVVHRWWAWPAVLISRY